MSFHEKSAWFMAITLTIIGVLCGVAAFGTGDMATTLADGNNNTQQYVHVGMFTPFLIASVIVLIVVLAVGHAIIAIMAPKEANSDPDEREKQIIIKAGHYSGFVLGFGVVTGLLHFLFNHDGAQLFFIVLASFILSAIFEYMVQIVLFRKAF